MYPTKKSAIWKEVEKLTPQLNKLTPVSAIQRVKALEKLMGKHLEEALCFRLEEKPPGLKEGIYSWAEAFCVPSKSALKKYWINAELIDNYEIRCKNPALKPPPAHEIAKMVDQEMKKKTCLTLDHFMREEDLKTVESKLTPQYSFLKNYWILNPEVFLNSIRATDPETAKRIFGIWMNWACLGREQRRQGIRHEKTLPYLLPSELSFDVRSKFSSEGSIAKEPLIRETQSNSSPGHSRSDAGPPPMTELEKSTVSEEISNTSDEIESELVIEEKPKEAGVANADESLGLELIAGYENEQDCSNVDAENNETQPQDKFGPIDSDKTQNNDEPIEREPSEDIDSPSSVVTEVGMETEVPIRQDTEISNPESVKKEGRGTKTARRRRRKDPQPGGKRKKVFLALND